MITKEIRSRKVEGCGLNRIWYNLDLLDAGEEK